MSLTKRDEAFFLEKAKNEIAEYGCLIFETKDSLVYGREFNGWSGSRITLQFEILRILLSEGYTVKTINTDPSRYQAKLVMNRPAK